MDFHSRRLQGLEAAQQEQMQRRRQQCVLDAPPPPPPPPPPSVDPVGCSRLCLESSRRDHSVPPETRRRTDAIVREVLRLRSYDFFFEEEMRRAVEVLASQLRSAAARPCVNASDPQQQMAIDVDDGNAGEPLNDSKTGTKRKCSALTETPYLFQKLSKKEWTCCICSFTAVSQKVFDSHVNGMQHRSRIVLMDAEEKASEAACGFESSAKNARKMCHSAKEHHSICSTDQTGPTTNIVLPEHPENVGDGTSVLRIIEAKSVLIENILRIIEANKSVLVEICGDDEGSSKNQNSRKRVTIQCKLCEITLIHNREVCKLRSGHVENLLGHLRGKKHKECLRKQCFGNNVKTSTPTTPLIRATKNDAVGLVRLSGNKSCEVIKDGSGEITAGKELSGEVSETVENMVRAVRVVPKFDDKVDKLVQECQGEAPTKTDKLNTDGPSCNNIEGICKVGSNPRMLPFENKSSEKSSQDSGKDIVVEQPILPVAIILKRFKPDEVKFSEDRGNTLGIMPEMRTQHNKIGEMITDKKVGVNNLDSPMSNTLARVEELDKKSKDKEFSGNGMSADMAGRF